MDIYIRPTYLGNVKGDIDRRNLAARRFCLYFFLFYEELKVLITNKEQINVDYDTSTKLNFSCAISRRTYFDVHKKN